MLKKLLTILILFFALTMVVLFISNPLKSTGSSDTLQFFGRFHPVVLHLPIGFFIVLGVLEALSLIPSLSKLRASTPIVLTLCIIGTLVAVTTGIVLAYGSGSSEPLVVYHMRVSLLLGIFSLGLGLLKMYGNKLLSKFAYGVALILTFGLLFVASHHGGSITHGEDYLTKFMPNSLRPLFGLEVEEEIIVASSSDLVLYRDVVHPIFEQNCNTCHNPNKKKGELNMETYDGLLKGGDTGYSIARGDRDDSELYFRITLPHDNDDFMPTDGKPPLSDTEVELIGWWIDQGADPYLTVAQHDNIPAPLQNYIDDVFNSRVSEEELEAREFLRQELYASLATLHEKLGIVIVPSTPNAMEFNVETFAIQKDFNDQFLEQLSPFADKIVAADFSNTQLTDQSFETLTHFNNLRSLNLSKTRIKGRDLGKLSQLSKLESLNLYGTDLTADYLEELAQLTQLKNLYLYQTELYESETINRLKQALPDCNVAFN